MKNQIYIQEKREKTIGEIRGIKKEFKKKPDKVPLLPTGYTNIKNALRIKFYQLSIIKKIQNNDEKILKKWLRLSRKKLCKKCRRGLKDGDIFCKHDLNVFILADMIRRSM